MFLVSLSWSYYRALSILANWNLVPEAAASEEEVRLAGGRHRHLSRAGSPETTEQARSMQVLTCKSRNIFTSLSVCSCINEDDGRVLFTCKSEEENGCRRISCRRCPLENHHSSLVESNQPVVKHTKGQKKQSPALLFCRDDALSLRTKLCRGK